MLISPSNPNHQSPYIPARGWIMHARRVQSRAAVLALARTRTMLGARGHFRVNWSDLTENPIRESTMRSLERRGLVHISNNRIGFDTARLTQSGELIAAMLQAANRTSAASHPTR